MSPPPVLNELCVCPRLTPLAAVFRAHYSTNAMNTASLSVPKNPISVGTMTLRYGLLSFGLMLLYFLAVNALQLQHSELARFGSHAFTVLAVGLAVRAYRGQVRGPAPYLGGRGLGFAVGLLGLALYATFILLYANVFGPAYQAELNQQTYFDTALGPGLLAAIIVLLGIVIGSLRDYVLMMANGTNAQAMRAESQDA